MRRIRAVDYDSEQEILPGVRFRLRDAGHILGSAVVELWLREDGLERKLVFSGDLGHRGAPILREPSVVEDADLVVMESTYGDRLHRDWQSTWDEMGEVLAEAAAANGNILIPSFAVGRTQELLYGFLRNFDAWNVARWEVFLDSPMAIAATEVYTQHPNLYDADARLTQQGHGNPFRLPNLHLSQTAKQSMAINRINSGAMIIAGSGMCTGGRIRHHLKHNVWRSNCHLIFVGFQARGTLGRKLVDGAHEISLWGERIRVAAKVHTIGGFSAHADQAGLLDWYGHFRNRPKVALVHGEPEAMECLQSELTRRYQASVFSPAAGTVIDLEELRI